MLSVMIKGDEAPPGTQIGPFVVSPSNQWQARIPRGMSTNGLIAITNASAQPVRITKAESDGDAFTYELQTIEEGKRYALSFTSSAKLPAGAHRQMMKLATDSKETPVIELNLEAVVSPAVTISPASLTFESVPVSDPEMEISLVSKFLWVRLGRGTGLEVTSMTSDLPFVKVKVESTNGVQVLLRVGFSEKPPKGTHAGKIKLTINNPDVKEAEIPVTVTAR
ncbi:MAG: hypothetical protein ACREEM_46575 [Blastocatellia bacterium]